MLKRFAILGLVLLFAGSAALAWVLAEKREEQQQTAQYQSKDGSELHKEMQQYDEWLRLPAEKRTALPPVLDEHGGIKTKAQLLQQQQARFKADLDKLAGGETDARALADFLYGENWQQELSKYKGRQEKKELILNSSIVCMSIGGAIFAGCLLLCTIRVVIKVSSGLGRLLADTLAARRQSRHFQKTATPESFPSSRIEAQPDEVQATPQLADSAEAAAKAGQACSTEQAQSNKPLRSLSNINKQRSENRVERQPKYAATAGHALHAAKIELDRYAETCVHYESEEPPQAGEKKPPLSLGAPDPLNNTLVELTQHVAAIREYASTQQDRVKKLQEGYDWNIIRNFCLRVIRCIDNVENRIRERAGQNGEAAHLSEIRDELLFALESSGIEQFEPEINRDYRGLEKQAEAVKERESCDDPDLAGKIAKIIRPGYHYFMDDKHVRIVRPAMVMLFG